MAHQVHYLDWLLGIVGGIIGGVLGYFAFFMAVRQGFYAMVMPGALVGLGCGLVSGMKSNPLGIGCGLAALMLGVSIEWRFDSMREDPGFAWFITHIHMLNSVTLIMIGVGGYLGFWFGRGRAGGVIPGRRRDLPDE